MLFISCLMVNLNTALSVICSDATMRLSAGHVVAVFLQEERRVIYIGRIPDDFSEYDLLRKMGRFGEILNCSVHSRSYGLVFF